MYYSLKKIDKTDAIAVINYTEKAMEEVGMHAERDVMRMCATSHDYNHLLSVCEDYLALVNIRKRF